MEFSDGLIGPATISELRKTIAICTQTRQTDLKIIQNGNYTDGTTIFISPPPTDIDIVQRWILFEALAIHESWHILFQSDFYLLQDFVQKYEKEFGQKIPFIGKIAHDILNIIEDARIELHGKKRFVGTKNTITFNNLYWLKKRPSFKEMKDWQIFIEGLLQLGVCGGLKEPIQDSKSEFLVKVADFYLQWAKTHEKSRASFIAADKVMEVFLKNFEIEGSYSQQIPSPPFGLKFEPKSDSSNSSLDTPPDLPKELQEKLEKTQENKNIEKPDSRAGGSEKENNQNKSVGEESGENSENEGQTDAKNAIDSERALSGSDQPDIESDINKQTQTGTAGGSSEQEESGMSGNSERRDQSGMEGQSSEQEGAGMSSGSKGQEQASTNSGSSEQKSAVNLGDHAGERDLALNSGQQNKAEGSIGQEQSDINNNSQAKGRRGEEQGIDGKLSIQDGSEKEKEEFKGKELSELSIINIDDVDPLKLGLIDPIALRIKIDDLVKNNYSLSKDRGLEEQARYLVKEIKEQRVFKDVFYTKTFDIGVEINLDLDTYAERIFDSVFTSIRTLIQVTVNQFKALFKSGSQITAKLKFGRLDTHKMVRGLINEDPHIFKKNLINEGKNEIAIALLIDQSGSMQGEKILNAQKGAILFGEVLNALNLNFAIYGWTDIPLYEAHIIHNMRRMPSYLPSYGDMGFPAEINPEIFNAFCYKDFNDPYEISKQKLGMISAIGDNSDHNAIEFMTEKLRRTKKRIKILMVLSDGQPNATSYQFIQCRLQKDRYIRGNRGNIGINLTRQAIETAQKLGIQTLCISIDTARNYQEQIYGQNNYVIVDPNNIQELPIRVAKILSLILRGAGVKV